jgi:hypothetical protein
MNHMVAITLPSAGVRYAQQLPFWFLWRRWYAKSHSVENKGLASIIERTLFKRMNVEKKPS